MTQRPAVVIHTDGACSGNPGPGGWGAILTSGKHRKEISGGEAMTNGCPSAYFFLSDLMAPRASSSARSFSGWPACPRSQCHWTS